jgi:futalosine hydrolase
LKILLVAATVFEIMPTLDYLSHDFEKIGLTYKKNALEIEPLVTGVGLAATAFHLGRALAQVRYDWVLNVGIAGAFPGKGLAIGDVVQVASERFADLGVEEADGRFVDVHEMELVPPGVPPFKNGLLENPAALSHAFLRPVQGISVNKVHGSPSSIKAIVEKYHPDTESMEGAAVFYACLLNETPFAEIRAISNFVEPRNRSNWNIPLAIENLNKTAIEMLGTFL